MRRPDEVPNLEVVANMLAGFAFGLLLIVFGRAISAGDDNLIPLDDPLGD